MRHFKGIPRIRIVVSLLIWGIAGFTAWLVLRTISIEQIVTQLGSLKPAQILLWAVLNALIASFLGVRWWILLRAQGIRIPYLATTAIRLTTYSVSYFTPGPHFGGEPLQAYLITRRYRLPAPLVTASIAVDKFIEVIINFTMIGAGIIFVGTSHQNSYVSEILFMSMLFLTTILIVFLFALAKGLHPLSFVFHVLRRFALFAQFETFIVRTEDAIAELWQKNPAVWVQAIVVSFVLWTFMILEYSITFSFFAPNISLQTVLFSLTATRLAILAPLPGGWGSMEAGQILAMRTLGVDPTPALSLIVLIHLRDVILGVIGFTAGGIMISDWYTEISKHNKYDYDT